MRKVNGRFNRIILLFIVSLSCLVRPVSAETSAQDSVYLFSSFRGSGDGLHLAWSEDGYQWTELEGIFLTPGVGNGLMRDPHILPDVDGTFHMVWTTGWKDQGIGYASSKDLMSWSEQTSIPVMEDIEGTQNCWAPETFYDTTRDEYVITWSSDVQGRFADTVSNVRMNNRTYFVTTKDFKTFSKAKLFFDPGFDHIDASIIQHDDQYVLTIKEGDKQKIGKWGPIYQAFSKDPQGPYTLIEKPVLTQQAEGPNVVRVGQDYLMYVDFYSAGRYGALKTRDFKDWQDITDKVNTVKGQRHGTVFQVPRTVLTGLHKKTLALPPAPVLPGYHADPHIAYLDGRYYIYPTTDGTEGWASNSFICCSSEDLVNWQNHGLILRLGIDIEWTDRNAWAPAIATKNGKYYYYFSAAQRIGVAVSDTPYGPFTDPLGEPLIPFTRKYGGQVIDPMVFIDDDGQAYLYFGQGNCSVVKLNDDMISYDPEAIKRITPPGYNEGAFVIKRKGVYYLMWSEFDTRDPRYSVAYGTSDSPMGPFKKAKVNPILKAKDMVKGAGHHSVVQVPGKDDWYIAYHRFAIPGGSGYKRETCISPMYFNEDGTIKKVDVFEAAKLK